VTTSYETAIRLNGQHTTGLKRTKAEEERELFDNRVWIRRDLARIPSGQGSVFGQAHYSWNPDYGYDLHLTPLNAMSGIHISLNSCRPPAVPLQGAAESCWWACQIGTAGKTETPQREARLSRIATITAAVISAIATIIGAIITRFS
jgi:hypothetical protein